MSKVHNIPKRVLQACGLGICFFSGLAIAKTNEQEVDASEVKTIPWVSIVENGRPEDGYDLTFDASDKCKPLLDALNEPLLPKRPGDFENYNEYDQNKYLPDDYLLKNKYSVSWEPIPGQAHSILRPMHYFIKFDLNNDGEKEWVIRNTQFSGTAPNYVDELFWLDHDPRPERLNYYGEITGESSVIAGKRITSNIVIPYPLSEYGWDGENPAYHWTELVEVNGTALYLSTRAFRKRNHQRINIKVYQVEEKQKGTKVCEIVSNYEISNLDGARK